LQTDYEGIAFELREDVEVIKSVLNDFNLFQFDDNCFGSLSVQKRLDERNERSAIARQSANKRWSKTKDDANALQTQSKGNAIKERKEKEKKVSLIKKSFQDSELIDKNKFKDYFPQWNKTKLAYYYDSALSYSAEGNKYANWGSAIRNWAKRDELQGKLKFDIKSSEQTETLTKEQINEQKRIDFMNRL
jgi:hypothetical protein